jgi:hypothetical protein
MANYTAVVRRFGGARPYRRIDDDGKFNLNQTTSFDAVDVRTDGKGIVHDMPLLERKPCFGRPERYIRGLHEEGRKFVMRDGTVQQSETACGRCPVRAACGGLSWERIKSDANIEAALSDWITATDQLTGFYQFIRTPLRFWHVYLDAIISHGPWPNVNDARVSAAKIAQKQERDEKRRKSAKAARMARRPKARKAKAASRQFIAAVDVERDRRLNVLLDLRQQPCVPAWITKLPVQGCERTADVWRILTILARSGNKISGKVIADELARKGQHQNAKPDSLRTVIYKDWNRVKKLENSSADDPIWTAFD